MRTRSSHPILSFISIACLLAGCSTTATTDVPVATDVSEAGAVDHVGITDTGSNESGMDSGVDVTGTDVTSIDAPADAQVDAPMRRDRAMVDVQLMSTPGAVSCFATGACSGSAALCCSGRGADGGFLDMCVMNAAMCPTPSRLFACDEAADCPGGTVCCGDRVVSDGGRMTLTVSSCATTCMGMQVRLCSSDADCATGQTCNAEMISGRALGICL